MNIANTRPNACINIVIQEAILRIVMRTLKKLELEVKDLKAKIFQLKEENEYKI